MPRKRKTERRSLEQQYDSNRITICRWQHCTQWNVVAQGFCISLSLCELLSGARMQQQSATQHGQCQNTLSLDQRAWVGVQDVVGQSFTETNGLIARIIFFNSGRSPAHSVQSSARFIVSPIPFPEPPDAEGKPGFNSRSAQSMAPPVVVQSGSQTDRGWPSIHQNPQRYAASKLWSPSSRTSKIKSKSCTTSGY